MDTNEHDDNLRPAFDALRGALDAHQTPRGVEKELLAAFAKRYPRKRWYQHLTGLQWSVAGGLGSSVAVALVLLLAPHARPPMPGSGAGTPLVYADNGAAFIALDTLESIQNAPDPQVVQADVPRSALAAAGVPVTPETAGEPVHAEMLVSADGRPLAFRLTSNP